MDDTKSTQTENNEIKTMNYNDRADGYGFGEAESRDHSRPYEEDDYFNDRNYDVVRGYCGRKSGQHGRDWNRWRFEEPYTRDEYGLRNQYGPVDQYSFRDVYIRQWSRPSSRVVYDALREDYRGKGPKGYARKDESILEDACETLFRSPTVDASEIQVEVIAGCIYLRGLVDNRAIKKEIERLVEDLPGVRNIQNEIKVRRWF
jgi:hypothetical protein